MIPVKVRQHYIRHLLNSNSKGPHRDIHPHGITQSTSHRLI
jgi:hypothetical protein